MLDKEYLEKKVGEIDLSFQYSRESSNIGKNIKYSDSALAKVLSKTESLRELSRRKRINLNVLDDICERRNKDSSDDKAENDNFLENYKHSPKKEHPLYSTTANNYGIKQPTFATYNAKSLPKNQSFSKSFNNMMFRDLGLNTSMTKSNVHEQMDFQFA